MLEGKDAIQELDEEKSKEQMRATLSKKHKCSSRPNQKTSGAVRIVLTYVYRAWEDSRVVVTDGEKGAYR